MATILEGLTKLCVEHLGVTEEEVKMDVRFRDDLGADSLDVVELIMEVEEEFDIEIPDDAAEQMVTVGDVVEYIEKHQS